MANQIDREALVEELMHAAIDYGQARASESPTCPNVKVMVTLEDVLESKIRALVCGRALETVTH